jgi:hypothetical protein
MREYLLTIGRRLTRWTIGAGGAILFYAGGTLIGLPGVVILVLAFIGAILGSLLALRLTPRLFGPEPEPAPRAPRGRGTGRRGA